MKEILLLIRSITLIYRDSQLPTRNSTIGGLVKEVVETVKLPEGALSSSDDTREMIMGLRSIALAMANSPDTTVYSDADILQKVRLLTRYDDSLHDALKDGIAGDIPEEANRVLTTNIRRELTEHLREVQAIEIIKAQSKLATFKRDEIGNLADFIANFRASLEQFEVSHKEKDPAITGEAFMSDVDKVESVFALAKELNNDAGLMRTGWQALNRMLQGGFRRGEEWVIGALQHNFKTGFSMSVFKHIAMYNTPYMINPKKKPLLLRISLEDPLSLNFPFMYRNIKENQTYEFADTLNTPPKDMASFIHKELTVNGYEVLMIHVNPTQWGYRDLLNYTNSLENDGYEIHLVMIDYLNMLSKKGLDNTGPNGSNIRELFRVVANHYRPRKTTVITPHQLSTEAKMLIRQGADENFVKDVANRGYYDSCKTLDQEVDGELYIHKVIVEGRSFLTVQRGKHRLVVQTKLEYLYTVLTFEDIGDIRDDLHGADSSRKRPNGPKDGEDPSAVGFWNFDGS